MKKAPKTHILDRLHRGVVWSCLGLTAYGTYLLAWRVHRYFTVIRPQRQEQDMKMLQSGAATPISPDSLVDHAPKMRT